MLSIGRDMLKSTQAHLNMLWLAVACLVRHRALGNHRALIFRLQVQAWARVHDFSFGGDASLLWERSEQFLGGGGSGLP